MSLLDLFRPAPRPTSPRRLVEFSPEEESLTDRERQGLVYKDAWRERKRRTESES